MTSLAAAAKIHGRCPVDFTMGIFFGCTMVKSMEISLENFAKFRAEANEI
jgi:hypothetical protein